MLKVHTEREKRRKVHVGISAGRAATVNIQVRHAIGETLIFLTLDRLRARKEEEKEREREYMIEE